MSEEPEDKYTLIAGQIVRVEEKDPSGKDPHEAGAKLDHGKLLAASVIEAFPRALEAVVEVGTFGAQKYTLHGWQSVGDGVRRYKEAEYRHKLKRAKGELVDPDSGLLHEAHELWNALASFELKLREQEKADAGSR